MKTGKAAVENADLRDSRYTTASMNNFYLIYIPHYKAIITGVKDLLRSGDCMQISCFAVQGDTRCRCHEDNRMCEERAQAVYLQVCGSVDAGYFNRNIKQAKVA